MISLWGWGNCCQEGESLHGMGVWEEMGAGVTLSGRWWLGKTVSEQGDHSLAQDRGKLLQCSRNWVEGWKQRGAQGKKFTTEQAGGEGEGEVAPEQQA